jgi:hypothetical protein
MNKSTRLLITAAAVAGLYAGSLASRSLAAEEKAGTTDTSKQAPKDKSSCSGKDGCKAAKDSCKANKDSCKASKDSCKSKSSCNSKDGCSAKAETKKDEPKKS